jgi:Zn-dependent protease with chaperone function
MEHIYSPGPDAAPTDIAQPTSTYMGQAWLAMISLALFIVLYLSLAGWFAWTAYRVTVESFISGNAHYPLIAVCAGFLAVFMLKALFFIRRGNPPDAIEVTAAEQPRLFEYLYRLADEAGAPRPARVYLSARVNAAVFYDLSVLNLIFPSRKNLEIGLALVNVLTLSEIKAVLAHEFGHFGQRSMAIGRWVYIAYQIAEQVVAKRDAMDHFLQSISRSDLRLAWIGWIVSSIVWSIRSLIDTVLRLVLLAQRALSREMEFQADLVAVSLTGSDELVHSLHKLQAADEAWGRTLNFTDSRIRNGHIPHDLFAVQTRIVEKIGQILDDETYGRVPTVDPNKPEQHRVFKASFARPPQMWSTHPASADREENAKRRYVSAPHDARSAWLLFDDVENVKAQVTGHLIGETKATPSTADETLAALEGQYALLQYDPRYRGVYLGRSVVRQAARPAELYRDVLDHQAVQQALLSLYSPTVGRDLEKLRDLEQEHASLVALRDKVYQATGGRIVFRGREIPRHQLPAAIREVLAEVEQTRQRVLDHDRQCRSAHLAAAARLGGGWREYLIGLIEVMHYAEHTFADLRDARGLLSNVVAVVTANGKVSRRQRKRLIAAANMLHGVLAGIYAQQEHLQLDATLREVLGRDSWSSMLGEFKLPEASNDNLSDWMNIIDDWVDFAANRLYAVAEVALEQLLRSEDLIAQHLREGTVPEAAATPSRIPSNYPTLLPGQERKRQKRLGLWSRFQTADGFIAATLRLAVAMVLVGGVLRLGGDVGSTASLSIYNGLNRDVVITFGKQHASLPPHGLSSVFDIPIARPLQIETRTAQGELIESFKPELSGHVAHYVYNVAGASPLIKWAATYGNAEKQPPQFLDAPRWASIDADAYFVDPPSSVSTKTGGAVQWVLEGLGEHSPEEAMRVLKNDEARKQVILAHAKWDDPDAPQATVWKELAERMHTQSTR